MTDSQKARQLIDEMESLETDKESIEARILKVKGELARLLGLPQGPMNPTPLVPDPAPEVPETNQPAKTAAVDSQKPAAKKAAVDSQKPTAKKPRKSTGRGPVSKGTKGRQVLEVLFKNGGRARATEIADGMVGIGRKPQERVKKVRTYIYHLSRPNAGYLEAGEKRGVWRLSDKAYEALGKKPPRPDTAVSPRLALIRTAEEGGTQ